LAVAIDRTIVARLVMATVEKPMKMVGSIAIPVSSGYSGVSRLPGIADPIGWRNTSRLQPR
jgi:hypothetical protein